MYYLISPLHKQALDLGRYDNVVVVGGYEYAPPSIWADYNPRGCIERHFSGLKIARVIGVDLYRQNLIHDSSSAEREEVMRRCAHWFRRFGSHAVVYGVEETEGAVMPWHSMIPHAPRQVSTTCDWTLRSVFAKVDEGLVIAYENEYLKTVQRDIGFDFDEPPSPQLAFAF